MPAKAPYGTWVSPISAEAITKGSRRFADILVDPVSSAIYHIESRPSEAGRNVVVNTSTGNDVFGRGWNARTGVHEYGGASAIVNDGVVYFSHHKDGRVYRVAEGKGEPEPITPANKPHRFAAFAIHPTHAHLLVCILEDHTIDEPSKIINTLCVIDVNSKTIHPLLSGADFYACPKFSPDGKRIAWMQWHHPDMPWEGSLIHAAEVIIAPDGSTFSVKNETDVAGERTKTSALYPTWASNQSLVYTSDVSGFINPWKYDVATSTSSPLFPTPVKQEFGSPFWSLHEFPYARLDEEGKYALWTALKDGRSLFYMVDLVGGSQPRPLGITEGDYAVIDQLRTVSLKDHVVVFRGQKVDEEPVLVQLTIPKLEGALHPAYSVLRSASSGSNQFPKGIVSVPQPMTLPTPGGPVHVVFYPPQNPRYEGSDIRGERPPCVVHVHGGPTGLEKQGLNWEVQYFTSRGWAWVNVNYGGSSGYGRAYIDRLVGKWGVVDVEDCAEAARALSTGPGAVIDPKRVVIRGGSAGGYVVLRAVGRRQHQPGDEPFNFAAGNSFYGVSDLKTLTEEIHKFESYYLFKLIGGTYEEVPEIYRERSPLHHVEDIGVPLLILQGDIDKVVPKEQAEAMYESIKARGGAAEYKLYRGEGHGWRQEVTIRDALERELAFYEGVLGLKELPGKEGIRGSAL